MAMLSRPARCAECTRSGRARATRVGISKCPEILFYESWPSRSHAAHLWRARGWCVRFITIRCVRSSREIGPLLPGGGATLRTFAMLGGGSVPLAKSAPLYGGGLTPRGVNHPSKIAENRPKIAQKSLKIAQKPLGCSGDRFRTP